MEYRKTLYECLFPLQKPLALKTEGTSMWPLVTEGMEALVDVTDLERLPIGSLVLVLNEDRLILHRYWGRTKVGMLSWVLTKGDTNGGFDSPVLPDQVLGQVVTLQGPKGTVSPNRGWRYWYGRVLCSSYTLARVWAWACRRFLTSSNANR